MPKPRRGYKPRPLTDFGIQDQGPGKRWMQTCPRCSHLRKPHNRANRCLSVATGPNQLADGSLVDTDAAVWHCFHCGWSGSTGSPKPERRAQTFTPPSDDAERAAKLAVAKRLWSDAEPVAATIAARYLRQARAIHAPLDHAQLRFHFGCPLSPYRPSPGYTCPAMLAAIEVDGAHIGTHITFIRADGSGKAAMAKPRLIIGGARGGFVSLGRIVDAAIVAEGIESALSAAEALGLPAIAALSAGNMAKLLLPLTLKRVVIAHDRDVSGVGEAAAHELARRCIFEGRDVELAPPPKDCGDWNDAALAKVEGGARVG